MEVALCNHFSLEALHQFTNKISTYFVTVQVSIWTISAIIISSLELTSNLIISFQSGAGTFCGSFCNISADSFSISFSEACANGCYSLAQNLWSCYQLWPDYILNSIRLVLLLALGGLGNHLTHRLQNLHGWTCWIDQASALLFTKVALNCLNLC